MNLHREDVYCPACPDPETAFRIEDVGMKIDHEGDFITGNSVRVKVSCRMWEPLMLAHVACEMDDAHNRLHDELTAVVEASGKTVEEMAQDTVQATVDRLTRSMKTMTRARVDEGLILGETTGPLIFAAMRQGAELQAMQPVRPVTLPEPSFATVCTRYNLLISQNRQWAHDEACGCRP